MELIVTQEFIDRAKANNACSVPMVGTPVSELTQSQLAWCEEHEIVSSDELAALGVTVPLWCLSGTGDGGGTGDGYGDGYGDGRCVQ